MLQVLDSLPSVGRGLDGLSGRLSRASLSDLLAEVHGPKLPRPDLSRLSSQLTCLHTQLAHSVSTGMKVG